jgi:hypothetical protein
MATQTAPGAGRSLAYDEPAFAGSYPRINDVTLSVLPRSAHCHSFAATRVRLRDRSGAWAAQQAKGVRDSEAGPETLSPDTRGTAAEQARSSRASDGG